LKDRLTPFGTRRLLYTSRWTRCHQAPPAAGRRSRRALAP